MKLFLLCMSLLVMPHFLAAQTRVSGRVTDQDKLPLESIRIAFLHSEISCETDSLGNFELFDSLAQHHYIVVSHWMFHSDTHAIRGQAHVQIQLKKLQAFSGITFKAKADPRNLHIADFATKTEVITSEELKKAACCDLAGCFETQGTVQPMTTNIITNSKELRILGLSGVYNQVLVDGMPLIQGLTYTYGISSIPGTLVYNIFVAKGTTSVLQGYESMVGQINVIPLNPQRSDKLLFNAYGNSFGETQYNANYSFGKKKWHNLISAHVVQPAQKFDRDQDGFLDLPQLKRYMIYDNFRLGDENKIGLSSLIGMRFLWEERVGGQRNFNAKTDLGSNLIYGQRVFYTQPEVYTKTGYRFKENKKISFMGSAFQQDQNSWFGSVHYQAKQKNAYANLQYELDWNRTHELKTGVSYRYLNLNEQISFSDTALKRSYGGNYLKHEEIPGLFAENTFSWRGDIITLITGIRADYHKQFGWQVTPRSMLKYDLTEKSTLRASAGTGWRTVNLFSENIGLLVSSRNIIFQETLRPEKAFNWGLNFLQKFKKKTVEGYLTCDFYQTRFLNQFFPDYDSDPGKAYISNFTGPSISNGFQLDLTGKFYKLLEVKMAYNYLDVYRILNDEKMQLPFNAKHRLLVALSYIPKNKKWRGDLNAHWTGRQRLPHTEHNPEEYRQASSSRPFTTVNIQVTKTWKKIEFYGGCENILDYRQLKPIVSWQNPFSPYFDTSFNWGPTRGREIYIGIRYLPFKEK